MLSGWEHPMCATPPPPRLHSPASPHWALAQPGWSLMYAPRNALILEIIRMAGCFPIGFRDLKILVYDIASPILT